MCICVVCVLSLYICIYVGMCCSGLAYCWYAVLYIYVYCWYMLYILCVMCRYMLFRVWYTCLVELLYFVWISAGRYVVYV